MPAQRPPRLPDGITHWHGDTTGSWWAIVPGWDGPHLVEADTQERLAEKVERDLQRSADAQNRDDRQVLPDRTVRPAPVSAHWPTSPIQARPGHHVPPSRRRRHGGPTH
ncbi:hypothetical protein E1287_37325 [Actinomadura sp. KC06]|uniref:hypothetical protein n=1 Tax=Actinomadura sp. KC06 TaxID=2530369 RepID=UPI001044AD45|nr:hypothetical protein [Actinomadura sp. KC06]TDD25374.1 hypothetical protein E1287_37325 [Actinomadura sp. KC06]